MVAYWGGGGAELRRSSSRDPTSWEESLGVFSVSSTRSRGCFWDKDLCREIIRESVTNGTSYKVVHGTVAAQGRFCIFPSFSGLVFPRLLLPREDYSFRRDLL